MKIKATKRKGVNQYEKEVECNKKIVISFFYHLYKIIGYDVKLLDCSEEDETN